MAESSAMLIQDGRKFMIRCHLSQKFRGILWDSVGWTSETALGIFLLLRFSGF